MDLGTIERDLSDMPPNIDRTGHSTQAERDMRYTALEIVSEWIVRMMIMFTLTLAMGAAIWTLIALWRNR